MTDEKLIVLAKQAQENAYAPYSHFRVGAALLGRSGRVYTGCNVENASYGAAVCGERTAVYKAISEGERDFARIAVASSSGEITYPCGICLQVLAEFSPEIEVLLSNGREVQKYKLSELLPHPFIKEDIK
ncbi:MAG: cytidine deaminase [Bacillota bacterium]|nr:cytidine deaminase [Bacillota bacterium]